MSVLNLLNGDWPGNRKLTAFANQLGDINVHDLRCRGDALFDGSVRIGGNLILSTTSEVDVTNSTVYTFDDPLIHLNTTMTSPFIAESGLRIFRGSLQPEARLEFSEDPTRTTLEWRVGLGSDVLRIGRIADAMTERGVTYWDVSNGSLRSHPNILLYDLQIQTTIPIVQTLRAGVGGPRTQFVSTSALHSDVEYYTDEPEFLGGTPFDDLRIGFEDSTYGGTIMAGKVPTLSSNRAMRFRVRQPIGEAPDPRYRYLFEEFGTLGVDIADGYALLRTDNPGLRLNAPEVHITSGPAKIMDLTSNRVIMHTTLDMNGHILITDEIDTIGAASETISYFHPDGIELLPMIPGWDSTVTYNGTTAIVSATDAVRLNDYELTLSYSHVGAEIPATLVAPVQLRGLMENLRGLRGIHRKTTTLGGAVEEVHGVPMGDMWIQPPFDIDGTINAASCTGYSFLLVNIAKREGHWQVLITITVNAPPVLPP